jgi:hypothetical protein
LASAIETNTTGVRNPYAVLAARLSRTRAARTVGEVDAAAVVR